MIEDLGVLESIRGQDLFIFTENTLDFTNPSTYKLFVSSKALQISIPLSSHKKDFCELVAALEVQLDGLIIGWDLKNIQSYILGISGRMFPFKKFYDLKILESYLGYDLPRPTGFAEAVNRLKAIIRHPSWENLKKIYNTVYIPLITEVVPKIETLGLGHVGQRKILHPYYEISGQVNGRMKCSNLFSRSFNPHCLTEQDRHYLRPSDYDNVFMYYDFKNMEVYVLQWLSKDPMLDHVIKSYDDAYLGIWEVIAGSSNEGSREKCKKIFLPIVFGMGAEMVSKRLECSLSVAEKLKDIIYRRFKTAMDWVARYNVAQDGTCVDYFGRIRKFDNEYYKVRNFVIQSPASLICLHKLIKLYESIQGLAKVCFHLHDGYAIMTHIRDKDKVAKLGADVLQSEDELYSGLKLKVVVEQGPSLDKMEKI